MSGVVRGFSAATYPLCASPQALVPPCSSNPDLSGLKRTLTPVPINPRVIHGWALAKIETRKIAAFGLALCAAMTFHARRYPRRIRIPIVGRGF